MRHLCAILAVPCVISGCAGGLPRLQIVMPQSEPATSPSPTSVDDYALAEPSAVLGGAPNIEGKAQTTLSERLRTLVPSKETAIKGAAVAGGAYMAYRINQNDAANPIIPNQVINIGSTTSIALEKLVTWGAFLGTAYLVLDPFAPNWEIEEAQFPEQHYHMALKMKRLYAGGAGEAQQVFRQRAQELMRRNGYKTYDVVEYTESLESSILGSQRLARGVIQLRNPS